MTRPITEYGITFSRLLRCIHVAQFSEYVKKGLDCS